MAWQSTLISTLTNIFTAMNIKSCSVATVQLISFGAEAKSYGTFGNSVMQVPVE
jgi:hypothetical protein